RLHALRRRGRTPGGARTKRGTRDSAAGSDGAVQLSRQRSGAADAAHVAHAEQNLERLYWLMSRMQGYVGLAEAMGARFTASEPAFAPILRETARRGVIFVDAGAHPRSVAARVAGANNLPFAKADIVLDAVPTPDEIDRALGRLEMTARERSLAVGIASALPVSLEHIGKWAKAAESRGLLLVPITAVVMKEKQS